MLAESCATDATFIGVDIVHGREADHLACPGDSGDLEYWLDRETSLVVRSQYFDGLGTYVEEVIELEIGPQPADQFVVPPGEVVQSPRGPERAGCLRRRCDSGVTRQRSGHGRLRPGAGDNRDTGDRRID